MIESIIIITVYTGISDFFLKLEIKELNDNFFLTLKILEKIIDKKIYYEKTDTIIDMMIDYENSKNDSIDDKNKILEMIEELNKKHKSYKYFNFSLEKKKKSKYDALIDIVKNYKEEQSEENERKRNLLILDGYTINLEIIINKKTTKYIVKNPEKKSHPILKKLITESLIFFREDDDIISNDKIAAFGFIRNDTF